MKNWAKRIGVILAGLVGAVSAALFLAPDVLCETSVLAAPQGDAIVVLGGEPNERAPRAAELYLESHGSRVIVTGTGDCQNSRRILMRHGVRESSIHLECDSRTTRENAKNTIQILREMRARKVILVTSWYHSRRALHTFEHFAPDIQFYSMPALTGMHRWPSRWKGDAQYTLTEYVKIVGYALRWRILPV